LFGLILVRTQIAMNAKDFEEKIKELQTAFSPVVPYAEQDKLLPFDFTEANTELSDGVLTDTNLFMHYINEKLQAAGAKYGIGGYGEHRTIYSRSHLFNAPDGEEPRRLHLGLDIWGKPHTKVMAPLDGIVHSFAFHTGLGDYGGVIILSHHLADFSFYTLYGHLSLNSLKNLYEGQHVIAGDVFSEFGLPFENGQWPPHLHFQIILDIQGNKGDYPGVCKYSEKEFYMNNCPNPDTILGLMKNI
jgi:peptidoglycan LD-endopeptidase LytH